MSQQIPLALLTEDSNRKGILVKGAYGTLRALPLTKIPFRLSMLTRRARGICPGQALWFLSSCAQKIINPRSAHWLMKYLFSDSYKIE